MNDATPALGLPLVLALLAADLIIGFGLGWLAANGRWPRREGPPDARGNRSRGGRDTPGLLDEISHSLENHTRQLDTFGRSLKTIVGEPGEPANREQFHDSLRDVRRANYDATEQLEERSDNLNDLEPRHRAVVRDLSENLVAHRGKILAFDDLLENLEQKDLPLELLTSLVDAISDLHDSKRRLEQELEAARNEIAAQKARLKEVEDQARRDGLTLLPNRRAFDERLAELHALFERKGQSYACILFDMDKFKALNDTYGHGAGDSVLVVLGRILREVVRRYDYVARYGGEEFAVLLPQVDVQQAAAVAERCRNRVEQAVVRHNGIDLKFTVSAGVAVVTEGETADQLLVRTDTALYEAKNSGRNQLARHPGPEQNPSAPELITAP